MHLYNNKSKLITYCHPTISCIVSSPKYLQIISIWHQLFNVLVDLCWLLTLSSSFTKNHITSFIFHIILKISFVSNQATLFGMLKIKSMSFGNFPVYRFLHPVHNVNYFISPLFFHCINGKLEFCIYNPHEQESFTL